MEIQYQSDVGEDEKKLPIPVTLAVMAGITNSTGNPITFSPPFLSPKLHSSNWNHREVGDDETDPWPSAGRRETTE
ncbi:hypothetical protein ACLB2K_025163 [Fragaria x ananassa]